MKVGRLLLTGLAISVLVLVMAGCAKPPEAEKQAAKAGMDAAMAAGADKYAKGDWEGAKKVWDGAESQMNEKKYKEAKQGYIDAKTAFEKTAQAAAAGKKAVADEATAMVAAIEGGWKNLEDAVQKMGKKMKDQKEAWANDAKAVSEVLAKGKEMIAADAAGAKAKLVEVKGMVEKWENTIKEMAAAPAPKAKEVPKKKKK